ncbi:MAG: phosphatase PAP2 family protein [Gammaproteobacteria bacterium]
MNATRNFPLEQMIVPITSIVCLLVIFLLDLNQELFLEINALSELTGPALWANITLFGDGLVVFVLVLPFIGRRPDIVAAVFLTALIATLFVHGLKPLFQVARPPAVLATELFHIIGPAHKMGSFPSGHTTSAFALAGVLVLSIQIRWLTGVLLVLAILAGLSRIVVGVHWPMDVVAGMGLGWLAAVIGVWGAKRWQWLYSNVFQFIFGGLLLVAGVVLLTSHQSGYDQALYFQRIIAAVCLMGGITGAMRLRQH